MVLLLDTIGMLVDAKLAIVLSLHINVNGEDRKGIR
jgi:hypothetical protein